MILCIFVSGNLYPNSCLGTPTQNQARYHKIIRDFFFFFERWNSKWSYLTFFFSKLSICGLNCQKKKKMEKGAPTYHPPPLLLRRCTKPKNRFKPSKGRPTKIPSLRWEKNDKIPFFIGNWKSYERNASLIDREQFFLVTSSLISKSILFCFYLFFLVLDNFFLFCYIQMTV